MKLPSLLLLAAVALLGAAAVNLALAERHLSRPYDVTTVPDGRIARVAALGHRTLVSDLYWLSAVQYIGEPAGDARGWDKLFPLVDLVTDLDPRHGYAYQTAGIVLASAARIDESNRILLKGIEKGPPYWSFPFYLSFNHWFYLGDFAKGAEYARLAARTPGASANISHLALSLSSKSGTPEDALAVLEDLRREAKDEVTAARVEGQMKLAILERDAQGLERAVERFRAARGFVPSPLDQLAWEGYVDRIPLDPFGGRYVIDPADGRVHSTANPFRFSLPEPARQRAPGFNYQPTPQELRGMPE